MTNRGKPPKSTDLKTTPAPSAPHNTDTYAANTPKPSKATNKAKQAQIFVQIAVGLAALSGLVLVFIVLVR